MKITGTNHCEEILPCSPPAGMWMTPPPLFFSNYIYTVCRTCLLVSQESPGVSDWRSQFHSAMSSTPHIFHRELQNCKLKMTVTKVVKWKCRYAIYKEATSCLLWLKGRLLKCWRGKGPVLRWKGNHLSVQLGKTKEIHVRSDGKPPRTDCLRQLKRFIKMGKAFNLRTQEEEKQHV